MKYSYWLKINFEKFTDMFIMAVIGAAYLHKCNVRPYSIWMPLALLAAPVVGYFLGSFLSFLSLKQTKEAVMVSEELKKQHPTKDSVLELIHDIGFDYDGYETVNGLKAVIDELVELATYGLTLER